MSIAELIKKGAVFLLTSFFTGSILGAPAPFSLEVQAGAHDRHGTVVGVAVPKEARDFEELVDSTGKPVPFQIDEQGQGTFVLDELRAGQTRKYRLARSTPNASRPPAVEVSKDGTAVRFAVNKHPFLDYQAEPGPFPRPDIKPIYARGGYIYPIRTPGGRLVIDDFPPNHVHHHGVWFAWTKTEFAGRHPDFWNMGDGKGRVEFVGLDRFWGGVVQGGCQARHRFVDLTGTSPLPVLNESWRLTAYDQGNRERDRLIFDLDSEQVCATNQPLILPEYLYGGIGIRGNRAWDGKENAFFLTSEGLTNRVAANQTRGRWCYLGGLIEGQWAGFAILGHPGNFRAPQPLRIHPTEPYLCFAPSQQGEWRIQPGTPYRSRYRFVVFDGPPDRAELNRFWTDYAEPPEARIRAE